MSLELYNKVRSVPDDAKKPITGGRLNGKTDINPMWRIKTLTEQFGPCGTGWFYKVKDKSIEKGFGDEVAVFVDIELYYKISADEWSEPVFGTGGSMFVAKEKAGPYTSDECFKMALTDALSVACKALGIGADVYWSADASKYPTAQQTATGGYQPTKPIGTTPPNVGTSVSQTPEKAKPPTETAPKNQPAITGDRPAIAKVTTKDLDPMYKVIMDKDGKVNKAEADRFKEIYSRFGFRVATDITTDKFEAIKAEFVNYALPEVLK